MPEQPAPLHNTQLVVKNGQVLRRRCKLTRLLQTQVSQGQREADPQRQLDPNQQACLEWVTVVPDVELGDQMTQVLLELEPKTP